MRCRLFLVPLACVIMLSGCSTLQPSSGETSSGESAPGRQSGQTIMCDMIQDTMKETTDPIGRGMLEAMKSNCALGTADITLAEAKAKLGGEPIALAAKGDVLTLFQISENGMPTACCSVQDANWRDLGDGKTYAARFRLENLQAGMLTQFAGIPNSDLGKSKSVNWRGPHAPPKPAQKDKLDGALLQTTLYSPQLGETRRLFVYNPRRASKPAGTLPVIVVADGEILAAWANLVEPLIDAGQIAPVLMIGLVSGQEGIVEDRSALGGDLRMRDYLLSDVGAPSRFKAHLAFVTDTVLPWAESQYGASTSRENRVVTGFSNGGVFALNAGYQRPDVFGHAWPMSVGMDGISEASPPKSSAAKFRLSAGYYEPSFKYMTGLSAKSLKEAGYSVDTHWYAAGHMSDQWDLSVLENLKAVFPAKP